MRLLGVWISKAPFCRNCYLGCIDCVCSSQAVSFPLLSLFYFLFLTSQHPAKLTHTAWPSNLRPGLGSVEQRRPRGPPGNAGSVRKWQLSEPPLGHATGLLPLVLVGVGSRVTPQALLAMSSDEILTNLLWQTALNPPETGDLPCKHLSFPICEMGIIPPLQNCLED